VLRLADEQLVKYEGQPEADSVSTIWRNAHDRLRRSLGQRRVVLAKFKRSASPPGSS
jgi:hypothetical protein